MNLWSVNEAGGDVQQHTDHKDWDVRYASLQDGRIVYVSGADLWIYDIASHQRRMVPVTLASDLDQLREKWVTRPMQNLTSASIRPDGNAIVLTARRRVFVAPARDGRLVQVSRKRDGWWESSPARHSPGACWGKTRTAPAGPGSSLRKAPAGVM